MINDIFSDICLLVVVSLGFQKIIKQINKIIKQINKIIEQNNEILEGMESQDA